jgi:multiple sugar transport system permease protein
LIATLRRRRRFRLSARWEERLVGYGFLVPDVLGLLVFVALPIVGALYVSLHDWNGLGPLQFVGLDNYRTLMTDGAFIDSLRITVTYVVAFVPSMFVGALGLALLVNQRLRPIAFFRASYFVPVMLSLVVASVIWSFIFDEHTGALNQILAIVGLHGPSWLGSTRWALVSVVIVALWQGVGYNMIIFLAGLQDIPRDFYEAASIDGAGAWSRFWRITLPLLRPSSTFVLVTTFISSFQVFDPVYVLTTGGPANATSATVFYIYENAFKFLRIGYASAMAMVLFLIVLVFSLIQLRFLRDQTNF